jgi:hypothetical protein
MIASTPAAMGSLTLLVIALVPTANAFANDGLPRETDRGFEVSYTAGERDAAGHFMGGTELRNLSAHGGRLYAGNGYWMDRPGPEGRQPAQILVLDSPAAQWRIERSLDERMPSGRSPRHLAVSALHGTTFSTDRAGRALLRPVSMLFAGTWDLSGASQVMGRNDTSGGWTAMPLPVQRVTSGIQQVRALVAHRDRQTGVDHVFAGNDPYGIFSGGYDDAAAGGIRWGAAPPPSSTSPGSRRHPFRDSLFFASPASPNATASSTRRSASRSIGASMARRRTGSSFIRIPNLAIPKAGFVA